MVHPDWEAKLEAMKAAVARRANRRIVFRQVGDRLIPVGITSSRAGDGSNPTMATTTTTLPPNFLSQIAAALDASNEAGASGSGGRSRRGSRSLRRRGGSGGQSDEVAALLESLGLGGGPDIEEMMVQEAMRLSQLEEEERQKKAREDEAKKAAGQSGQPAEAPASSVPQTPGTTERLLNEAVGEDIHGSHASTSHSTPAIHGTPPVLAPTPHVDLGVPTSPASSNPAASSAPATSAAPELPPVSATVSHSSEASSAVPLTPNQGYQQLEGESDAPASDPDASSAKHGSEQQHLERNGGVGTLVDV